MRDSRGSTKTGTAGPPPRYRAKQRVEQRGAFRRPWRVSVANMLIIQKRGAHGSSVLAGQIAVAAGSPRAESVAWRTCRLRTLNQRSRRLAYAQATARQDTPNVLTRSLPLFRLLGLTPSMPLASPRLHSRAGGWL